MTTPESPRGSDPCDRCGHVCTRVSRYSSTICTVPVEPPKSGNMPAMSDNDKNERDYEPCHEWGYEMAAPTFTPICTLPKGHAGPHNWAERMELRARLRAEAAARREEDE